ncbi:MAG: DUF3524 domain-containing protein [Sedimentisphaerales bacterium]|nr:DUF3524 domain-containing protein [Sedimentisphaerales bacterium]MBN2842581.1 DUF3524 domain-containing protein [Sedimentisphaerales bacterium]
MTESEPLNILVLEAYDDGSHKSFLNGLLKHSCHNFVRISLPGRKWKWRMRGSALYFAREVFNVWPENASFSPAQTRLIFTSDMTNVADLKALLPEILQGIPIVCYFHENQLTYPLSEHDQLDYEYGFTNISSALSADELWFNSRYNRDEFVAATDKLLKKMPDFVPERIAADIQAKGIIMPLGMNPELFTLPRKLSTPPTILWNHRWEYDKNPGAFFRAIYELEQTGHDFKLIIAGESFRVIPAEFEDARKKLSHRIIHYGYAQSQEQYFDLISQSDIVVSTAIHEFFGISVMEAVSAGCVPLLPARLNYPHLLPEQYHDDLLYKTDTELTGKLITLLKRKDRETNFSGLREHAASYNWTALARTYDDHFTRAVTQS